MRWGGVSLGGKSLSLCPVPPGLSGHSAHMPRAPPLQAPGACPAPSAGDPLGTEGPSTATHGAGLARPHPGLSGHIQDQSAGDTAALPPQ